MPAEAVDVDRLADALAQRLAARLDERGLLSPKALAERLSLSERTVRDMLAAKKIPSIKVEGARRVEPAALDAYLAERRAA